MLLAQALLSFLCVCLKLHKTLKLLFVFVFGVFVFVVFLFSTQ